MVMTGHSGSLSVKWLWVGNVLFMMIITLLEHLVENIQRAVMST